MEIAKLFARIGVKADTGQLQSFTKGIGQAASGLLKLAGLAASVGAAAYALKKIAEEGMDAALAMKNLSAETGVSSERLQRLKAVADQVSGSGRSIESAVRAIAKNREALRLGEGNISPYQLLGIDPFQDPVKVLEDLRKQTQRMPAAMKANIIQQMGLSSDLIPLLELTNEEFGKMYNRAYVIPQSALNGLDKARQSLVSLGQIVDHFKGLIAAGLAPALEKFADLMQNWIRQNPRILEGMKKIGEWVGRFVLAVGRAVVMLDSIISSTIGWKAAIIGLIGVIALMNKALLLSPIGIFVIAILALILILEDLYVYSKGGKSLFGRLMNNSEGFKAAMDGLFSVFKIIEPVLKNIVTLISLFIRGDWSAIDELTKQWGAWGDAIWYALRGLQFVAEHLNPVKAVKDVNDAVGEKGIIRRRYEEAGGGLAGIWNAVSNDFIDFGKDFMAFFSRPSSKVPASGGNTTFGDIKVSVTESNTPKATAKAVIDGIKTELKTVEAGAGP